MMRSLQLAAVVVLAGPVGCYSGIDGSKGGEEPPVADDDGGDGVDGADDGDDGGSDDGGSDGDGGSEACDPGEVTLRFLTRDEYDNTIRDLLGDGLDPTSSFSADAVAAGFRANSEQAPSTNQLEAFVAEAEELGEFAAGERLDRFVSCAPADAGCADEFIATFGRLAFRRSLRAEEQAAYRADFDAITADQGAAVGLSVVAASMLSSPYFLYIGARTESDDPQAAAFDLASRLSYFVWSSMPDDALLDAAESGALDTPEGLEDEVRRMLEDDKAADMVASFASQWLQVDELALTAPKDASVFPAWSSTLADAAERESIALAQRAILEGDGRYADLLTSRDAYVDDSLAALYGVAAPAGGEGWVQLPSDQRAGLLTRVAFLSRHAHASENSWVMRGKVVRERMLCGELPPPPPVADDSPINDDSRLTDPSCAACHTLMDPIGTGFDQYDPIGNFVGGVAPGHAEGIEQPDFDGAVELSQRLADSDIARQCFAQQLYRYAHRRTTGPADACAVQQAMGSFMESDGDIVELIVALATAPTFATGQED